MYCLKTSLDVISSGSAGQNRTFLPKRETARRNVERTPSSAAFDLDFDFGF